MNQYTYSNITCVQAWDPLLERLISLGDFLGIVLYPFFCHSYDKWTYNNNDNDDYDEDEDDDQLIKLPSPLLAANEVMIHRTWKMSRNLHHVLLFGCRRESCG